MIIDGKAIALRIRDEIKEEVKTLQIRPGLAVVLVGDNPASKVYVSRKGIACDDVGFYSEKHELPENTTTEQLLSLITTLNNDKKINGILVQLPLPKHIDERAIINTIDPRKDVDGFHPSNVGKLCCGEDAFVPCTPQGIIRLIKEQTSIAGKHVVVVGRSMTVGTPVALLLIQENATVTVCHSKTKDLTSHTRTADILIVAVGKAKLITSDMVKERAIIIDVGVSRIDGILVGDVDFDQVKEKCEGITPVPGGVGPMTIAMLLSNTLKAAKEMKNEKN